MSNPHEPKECPDVRACMVRFNCITTKLDEMHSDMNKLSEKISNGLSLRISQVEAHVDLLQEDRTRREKALARVQTFVVGVLIILSTSAIFWGFKHYANSINSQTQTQPATKTP